MERSQILASSPILLTSGAIHPTKPKAKYGNNLPSTLQAAVGSCLKARFGGLLITSDETGERESEEKPRGEDGGVGKESLSSEVLSPLC